MKIIITSAIGGTETVYDFENLTTVREVKKKISQDKHIPEDTFVLAFRGKQLEESMTLKEAGVSEGDKLYLLVRTEGGGL